MAMTTAKQSVLSRIPSVDSLLRDAELAEVASGVPQRVVTDAARLSVEEIRRHIERGEPGAAEPPDIRAAILTRTKDRIHAAMGPHYRKVINATGIILHTALGRAVLPARAIRQIQEELSGYSLLQAEVETGKRARRDARIEWLLQQLTGAEAATVVNNNAAATAIVLNTVARGREVIVSRGHLIEIGGSFRLPEVMEASGVKLVEVGTTNKTHPHDYEQAITESTAAIMRLHPSNYKIIGFTSEVPLDELVRISRARNLTLIDDVGAGALIDFARFGFEKEPTLRESVATGADIVTSSADKLIGGSQGGIILGKTDWIARIRKNPLARIVRVGKLTLAALEATLTLFFDETIACREVPTLRMLMRPLTEIAEQADRIAKAVRAGKGEAVITTVDGFSQMGSGSLPEQNLATRLVGIRSERMSVDELGARLRRHSPPVFARIHKDQLLVDPRTLLPGEEQPLVQALTAALK
jgi:L-seryl-tRNA(Ser) seleniumtransferase